MTSQPTAPRKRARAGLTATAVAGLAVTLTAVPAVTLTAVPAASAATTTAQTTGDATPPDIPDSVTSAISDEGLSGNVQTDNGWTAVSGPYTYSDNGNTGIAKVAEAASDAGLGYVIAYSGDEKTGNAVLIFTGGNSQDQPERDFGVSGATVNYVYNDTNGTWYVYDRSGKHNTDVNSTDTNKIEDSDNIVICSSNDDSKANIVANFTFDQQSNVIDDLLKNL